MRLYDLQNFKRDVIHLDPDDVLVLAPVVQVQRVRFFMTFSKVLRNPLGEIGGR